MLPPAFADEGAGEAAGLEGYWLLPPRAPVAAIVGSLPSTSALTVIM